MNSLRSSPSESIVSVLSLACAAALPSVSADAAIIVDNSLVGQTVGFSYLPSVSLSLPGGAEFSLRTKVTSYNGGGVTPMRYFRIRAAVVNGAVGRMGAFRSVASGIGGQSVAFRTDLNTAVNWNDNAGARIGAGEANVLVSLNGFRATYYGYGNSTFVSAIIGPGGFSEKFLLFTFDNSGTTNYGWVELTTGTIDRGDESAMAVTIGRVAYDNSGALIGAGQVPIPEPASAALAMGGAMVVGAAGLRRWRRERAASS